MRDRKGASASRRGEISRVQNDLEVLTSETKRYAGCNVSSADIEAWTAYLLSVRGLAAGTAARYRFLVERALTDAGSITREAIEGHIRKLYLAGLGPAVRQGVVVALKSFLEWLAAHGRVNENPLKNLTGPKASRREVRPLTVPEVKRLIWGERMGVLPRSPQDMRNRALLAVLYGAGLRASEVGGIEAERDVMWDEERHMFSLCVRGKGGREDWLWVDRPVSRVLGHYLSVRRGGRFLFSTDRPLSRSAVRKILTTRLKESRIERRGRRLSPHILRHSIATHLLQAGVDIKTVQLHLRHRSITTTEKYLHSNATRVMRSLVRRSPLERRGGDLEVAPILGRLVAELGSPKDTF